MADNKKNHVIQATLRERSRPPENAASVSFNEVRKLKPDERTFLEIVENDEKRMEFYQHLYAARFASHPYRSGEDVLQFLNDEERSFIKYLDDESRDYLLSGGLQTPSNSSAGTEEAPSFEDFMQKDIQPDYSIYTDIIACSFNNKNLEDEILRNGFAARYDPNQKLYYTYLKDGDKIVYFASEEWEIDPDLFDEKDREYLADINARRSRDEISELPLSEAIDENEVGEFTMEYGVRAIKITSEQVENLCNKIYSIRFDEGITDADEILDMLSKEEQFLLGRMPYPIQQQIFYDEKLEPEQFNATVSEAMTFINENYEYTIAHERSHQDDDLDYSNSKCDLPPEYQFRLFIMSEVKARMVEGAMALEKYEQSGDLSGFDHIPSIDPEILEYLKQQLPNTKPEERNKLVAQCIHDGFLKDQIGNNTFYGKMYKDQIGNNTFYGKMYKDFNFLGMPPYAMFETEATQEEYNRRVTAMFADVPGMGDMTRVVNPDFALTPRMEEYFDTGFSNSMKDVMKNDRANAAACYDQTYYNLVQRVDADNIRTPEEQKEVDDFVAQRKPNKQLNNDLRNTKHMDLANIDADKFKNPKSKISEKYEILISSRKNQDR